MFHSAVTQNVNIASALQCSLSTWCFFLWRSLSYSHYCRQVCFYLKFTPKNLICETETKNMELFLSSLTEWHCQRHAWDVQAALLCQKKEGFDRQTLLFWHWGGWEVRQEEAERHMDTSEMKSAERCSLSLYISLSQTWRHYPAGSIGGQQAAVDGGYGWKRACMNISTFWF